MTAPAAPPLALDHLVVAAATLEDGVRFVEERLGAPLEPGGRHEGFGTHNALLRLGPDVYLEVLAPDPAQPAPLRPRLFGLDAPDVRTALAGGPRLLHWVARTSDLPGALAALAAAAGLPPGALGRPVPMRRGALAWDLALRDDGARPPAGLPSLIDWAGAPHPCGRLPERRVALQRLELSAPPGVIEALRLFPGDRVRATPGAPGALRAKLATPAGEAVLGGERGTPG
ncbi:VOC family protein [Anaeromyxobacter paludicola]|uniref:Glyoxalase n=1 Tax=Anaeromyxobacter paludicola TaxID=2918171 RepID=A0ABM7X665_9BACT|nr:VOC family protein [Anaeromyxobacter paludicola]BDG07309.1 glyoxalase [Anaeromyxobacter paludicola]